MSDRLERILDKEEIRDVLARYARGVDRRDWNAVRAAFHPDAHDDHGEYKGGVEGFIAWVSARHAAIEQSMHFLGNCLIEFPSLDAAVVETYYVAIQRIGAEAGDAPRRLLAQSGAKAVSGAIHLEVFGRYIDRFERRGGTWRIARRVVAFEAVRAEPSGEAGLSPAWVQALRSHEDAIYAARRDAGLAD